MQRVNGDLKSTEVEVGGGWARQPVPELRALPMAVTEAAESELPVIRGTLVDAFATDPMVEFFLPSATERLTGLMHIFKVTLRHGLLGGAVDVVQGGAGVAIWLRSEQADMNFWRMLRVGMPSAAVALGYRASRRILRFMAWLESRRKASLPGRHWYLLNLGVRPDLQGRGFGSILLRHGLERARNEGLPCFLETCKARNVPFYQGNGFKMAYQGHAPMGGPPVWGFVT